MSDIISSLQNNRVKLAHQLQKRAGKRRKERKIVLEGTRLVGDAIQQGRKADFIFYDPQNVDYDLLADLQNRDIDLSAASSEVIAHMSDTQSPQGLIAVFPLPHPKLPKSAERVLILDAIREPGNMGTILRTAGAAGVDVVILAPDCVDPYNPKVLRSGMGAHFRLPIVEADWSDIHVYCQDLGRYAAAGAGEVAYSAVDWAQKWALVIGNEAHGIGSEAGRFAQSQIFIPMASATESINAGGAAAVILFEAQRQRLLANQAE